MKPNFKASKSTLKVIYLPVSYGKHVMSYLRISRFKILKIQSRTDVYFTMILRKNSYEL